MSMQTATLENVLAFAASHGQCNGREPFIQGDAVMVDMGEDAPHFVACRSIRDAKRVLNY